MMRVGILKAVAIVGMLSALIIFTACRSNDANLAGSTAPPQPNASRPAAAVQTTTYHGAGVVKSINVKQASIEIDHEDIPDLMPAMTMEFHVKDKSLLDGLKSGDKIDFTMENGVGGLKITEIRKR